MEKEKIKIFLADDHHVFREGLRVLLESEMPVEVVGEAANGEEILNKLPGMSLDVLLLDIDMPGMNGMDLMKQLSQQYPSLPVLVLSSHDNEQYVLQMVKNGAKGYILKSCRKDELAMAIKTVTTGASYFGKEVSEKLFNSLEKSVGGQKKEAATVLTEREIEILKLVAKGYTNQEIGKKLFISHRTVDTHRRNMMVKLNLHNAASLTRYAAKKGLLSDN